MPGMNTLLIKVPTLRNLIDTLTTAPDHEFLNLLVAATAEGFYWSETDMFHWIPILNKIEAKLKRLIKLLDIAETTEADRDGHYKFIIKQLEFTKMLWDNSANRDVYSSYEVCTKQERRVHRSITTFMAHAIIIATPWTAVIVRIR
jgi:hypothetical protein